MISRLILCFGWWGIFSVLFWSAAVYACVLSVRCERRYRRFTLPLILAVLGFLLAMTQSAWQQSIELDKSEELRASEEASKKVRLAEEKAKIEAGGGLVRFAEDAPGESVSTTIMTVDELKGRVVNPPTNGAAASSNTVSPTPVDAAPSTTTGDPAVSGAPGMSTVSLETEGTNMPGWMAEGKKARVSSNKLDKANADVAKTAEKVKDARVFAVKLLKHADYQLSKIEANINRLLAKLVLLVVLILLVGDYLFRFNHPTDGYLPLPLAPTWLTHFSYGEPRIYWPGANEEQLRLLRDDIVRRGQTFLYVGDRLTDGMPVFHRIHFGKHLPPIWPLRVIVWGRDHVPADAEFTLDAVWFNRYAMCVPAKDAGNLLAPLLDMLAMRASVHATAQRLPHIIWDSHQPMDAAVLARLGRLCDRTGLRLIMINRHSGQTPDGFFTMPPGSEPRPGLQVRPSLLARILSHQAPGRV
ncbi:MAG: hypothetical protein ACOYOU_00535 [Kiritimatiellia bacterium]